MPRASKSSTKTHSSATNRFGMPSLLTSCWEDWVASQAVTNPNAAVANKKLRLLIRFNPMILLYNFPLSRLIFFSSAPPPLCSFAFKITGKAHRQTTHRMRQNRHLHSKNLTKRLGSHQLSRGSLSYHFTRLQCHHAIAVSCRLVQIVQHPTTVMPWLRFSFRKIGRASCRERVSSPV